MAHRSPFIAASVSLATTALRASGLWPLIAPASWADLLRAAFGSAGVAGLKASGDVSPASSQSRIRPHISARLLAYLIPLLADCISPSGFPPKSIPRTGGAKSYIDHVGTGATRVDEDCLGLDFFMQLGNPRRNLHGVHPTQLDDRKRPRIAASAATDDRLIIAKPCNIDADDKRIEPRDVVYGRLIHGAVDEVGGDNCVVPARGNWLSTRTLTKSESRP
jgi:hypothetical protein